VQNFFVTITLIQITYKAKDTPAITNHIRKFPLIVAHDWTIVSTLGLANRRGQGHFIYLLGLVGIRTTPGLVYSIRSYIKISEV
jgi:hypothetical protein